MNLGTLLQTAGDLCDLSPKQSPDALDRQKRFANLAITELANVAPYLFRSDQRRYLVPGSLKPLSGETILVDGDAWLLKLDTADAAAIAQWRLDGTHATQAIYLEGSSGTKVRRIIQGVADIGGEIFITITEPWPNTTDTGLTWEVLSEDFYLPKDLKSIDHVRLTDATNTWYRDIRLIGETEGRKRVTGVINRLNTGNPWEAYPGGDVHLPTPAPATGTTTADVGAWSAYTPGTFEYTLTLAWGARPEGLPRPQNSAATAARLSPLIESEPTAAVSVTVAVDNKVVLTLPDIRRDLAMTTGTRADAGLVGYYLCIYRAKPGERPLLWRTIPAGTTTADDDGTIIPDLFRPIHRDGGARSLSFDAIPAEHIIVNGTWVPPRVVHANDSLEVDETGGRALVELLVERIQRKLNNPQAASGARARFELMLSAISNEQSTGQDPAVPRRRRTRRIGDVDRAYAPPHTVDYDWGN